MASTTGTTAKKGDARRITLNCKLEGKAAQAVFMGPDPDGDVEVMFDHDNEPELSMVFDRESQQELLAFLKHALGEK